MDRLSGFRQVTGYSNEQLEKMTGYTRQGLNKAYSKIHEGKSPQAKLKIILDRVIDQRIAEETVAYETRLAELRQLKERLKYDYEETDCKVLQFAKVEV
jgi:hypothetical protein